MTNLEKYYNKFHEENRLTTRHGTVEFLTTMHFIEEVVSAVPEPVEGPSTPIKIADIGAGTGRYSVELCHRGYDVTAVELVPHNLEILRGKHENIKTWQGDARNLHFLEDETFDITLLFGPLYHLHGDEEKLKALSEARRITKKGGYILVADKGGLTKDFHTVCREEDLYDYVRLEDINRLNAAAGLERIKIISADGAADYMRRELNEMSQEEFEAFCKYQLAVCERPELLGASSHLVDILKAL